MARNNVDLTLNLNSQALAVLHQLASFNGLADNIPDPHEGGVLYDVRTWAYYNGRERGFALTCGASSSNKMLTIACVELRNGDSICVDHWESKAYSLYDPPTWEDWDKAGAPRKTFKCGEVGKAAEFIFDLIDEHSRRLDKEQKQISVNAEAVRQKMRARARRRAAGALPVPRDRGIR